MIPLVLWIMPGSPVNVSVTANLMKLRHYCVSFSIKTKFCSCSLDPQEGGYSTEHPLHMMLWKTDKNILQLLLNLHLICSFATSMHVLIEDQFSKDSKYLVSVYARTLVANATEIHKGIKIFHTSFYTC